MPYLGEYAPGRVILTSGMADDRANGLFRDEIAHRWQTIAELQDALVAVGAIAVNERCQRGTFDKATAAGVRRFQWYYGNVAGYLDVGGTYRIRIPRVLTVDGVAGPKTLDALREFAQYGHRVAGQLVRVKFTELSRVYPNVGFTGLIFKDKNIGICDRDFYLDLFAMNKKADELGLYVFVNQLFRVEGSLVSGAVYPPASNSAHKIGRAIDIQLGTSHTKALPAAAIKAAKASEPFGKFRQAMKAHGLRYGGDFTKIDKKTKKGIPDPDVPHFDRQLTPAGGGVWKTLFYLSQFQFGHARINGDAIPEFRLA